MLEVLRYGLEVVKSARWLDVSGMTTYWFGEMCVGGNDGVNVEKSVWVFDWFVVGVMGCGEWCVLVMCVMDGMCEAFASSETEATSAWR